MCLFLPTLGGNQRELARQKNQKKQQEVKKSNAANAKEGNKGLSLEERKLRYYYHPYNSLINCVKTNLCVFFHLIFLFIHRDAEVMRLKQQKALEKKQAVIS